MAHERRRVTAALDFENSRPRIATDHVLRKICWQQVRMYASKHEDRSLDGRPVFPEVKAVVPRVAKGADDLRVAEHEVTLSARMPRYAVTRNLHPVLVRQLSKRSQNLPEIVFGLSEVAKLHRHVAQIGPDAGKALPRQEGTDIVDHEAADEISRHARKHDADQSSQGGSNEIHFFGAKSRHERVHVSAILRERVFIGISQPATAPAPDEGRTYDAPSRARELGCQIIKIAPLPSETVNTQDGNARIGRAPIHIGNFVKAAERQAEDRSSAIRLELGLGVPLQRDSDSRD